MAVEGFGWDGSVLEAYAAAVAADGAEGRMVMVFQGSQSWQTWERHPAGDEVVICLSGRMTLIREVDGEHEQVAVGPHEAMINPCGGAAHPGGRPRAGLVHDDHAWPGNGASAPLTGQATAGRHHCP